MGRAPKILGLGELLRLPPGFLLLSYTTLLVLVQVTTADLLPRPQFKTAFVASSGTPLSGKSAVDCCTILSTRVPSTASHHLVRRGLRSNFPLKVAPPPNMVSATLYLSSLKTTGEPSSSSSHLSKLVMQQSLHLSPEPGNVPSPVGDNSSSDSNVSSVPPGLAEPPISHHSGCCGLNMVQRRGTRDCHCVYPVKVELFLWNVSQRSNWSNEFLEKLASQLNLQVTQFEIDNFYVVGLSGLNITMDIAPHTGISFSSAQVHAMNISLTLHEVFLDPNVIGGYKVLNFTWFEPPAPAPGKIQSLYLIKFVGGLLVIYKGSNLSHNLSRVVFSMTSVKTSFAKHSWIHRESFYLFIYTLSPLLIVSFQTYLNIL